MKPMGCDAFLSRMIKSSALKARRPNACPGSASALTGRHWLYEQVCSIEGPLSASFPGYQEEMIS